MRNEQDILSNIPESEMMNRMREGDDKIIRYIYDQNKQKIFNYLRSIRVSLPKEDLYQEAFMVMLSNVYEKDLTCKISTFLHSVVRNLSLKELRLLSRETDNDFVDVDIELNTYQEECVKMSRIEKAMDQLSEKCRSIIQHFYMFNWTMDDIAEKFSYTNALNAKNQKYKCMKKLKDLIHV